LANCVVDFNFPVFAGIGTIENNIALLLLDLQHLPIVHAVIVQMIGLICAIDCELLSILNLNVLLVKANGLVLLW
jgi:hypothetical protein